MTKVRPSTHQHKRVVNRNFKLRELRERDALFDPPTLNTYTGHETVGAELQGRMNVQAVRDIEFKVPVKLVDPTDVREPLNPLNQLGAVVEGAIPVVTSPDFDSFMAAFNKRSNFMQDGPEDDISDVSFAEALKVIAEIPDNLFCAWDENDADRERWMAKFDPAKRTRMEAAYGEISGCSSKYLGAKTLSVKAEALLKRDDETWAPRIIYAGNDAFNAVTGPASMVMMDRLIHLTRVLKIPIGDVKVEFAYKTTDTKLCEFLFDDESLKETVEGDFSRNDREQRSRTALIYDAWLAKLNLPSWFRKLLMKLEEYKVVNYKYGLEATLKYQLPTGTTSTTPRNSTYNGTMFAVSVRRQKLRARAVILGDDILARMNRRLCLTQWVKDVASFKMVLKAKSPRIDGAATFLSRRIFADVDRPCMVPLLGKMLARFNVRATNNEAVSDSQYMAGKALSYAYECRHVPMLSDVFMKRFHMEGDSDKVQPTDLTWFAKSSGMSKDDLIRAIRYEPVKINDWDFGAWCCIQYDLDFEEVKDMFETVILGVEVEVLDLPLMAHFYCDLG